MLSASDTMYCLENNEKYFSDLQDAIEYIREYEIENPRLYVCKRVYPQEIDVNRCIEYLLADFIHSKTQEVNRYWIWTTAESLLDEVLENFYFDTDVDVPENRGICNGIAQLDAELDRFKQVNYPLWNLLWWIDRVALKFGVSLLESGLTIGKKRLADALSLFSRLQGSYYYLYYPDYSKRVPLSDRALRKGS